MRFRPVHGVVAAALLACSFSLPGEGPADEQAAVRAEMTWLHLIDAGNYHDAWSSAGKLMQQSAPEGKFTEAIRGARSPLGALATRTLKQAQAVTQVPGAPDGHYVVAQYTTRFANKENSIETVVASEEADGLWHVSGYFIR